MVYTAPPQFRLALRYPQSVLLLSMNKGIVWCRRLLFAVLFVLVVAWVETLGAQWILRTRAQNLLADVRSFDINHSRWADAQQRIAKWGRWGATVGDCNAESCIY